MSVATLFARLDELATGIDRQKEILRNMERTRSAVRRQLNDLRDPMMHLPLELSSKIFVHSLPVVPDYQKNASQVPLLLLKVYHSWTNIALHTPALWTGLNISTDPLQISRTVSTE
jgi:hypothetical protein